MAIVENLVIRQLAKAKPQSLDGPCQVISDFAHAAITARKRQSSGKFLAESLVPDLAMLATLTACKVAKATVLQTAVSKLDDILGSDAGLSPVQVRLKAQEAGRLIVARAREFLKLKEQDWRVETASQTITQGAARFVQMILDGHESFEYLDSECTGVLERLDDLQKESPAGDNA